MSHRRIGARLERLERHIGPQAADLKAEAARYGELRWTANGCRFYARQGPDGAQLSFVGATTTTYVVAGVDVGDLS